ncbi:MAG: DegT/DnrJ/EryC1/StrS aminotransferase family protein [Burkholderiales bacterium]|nr:DegT/DnrJ/EryC1/StrS aminotransferase family protein [Burkholderiales bacterium]
MESLPHLPFTRPDIDEATIAEVGDVLRSGWITSGPKMKAFEAALSELCGGRPVRVLNSATGGMELALRLCNIGPGDEVITTPMSWVATANVTLAVGATPVFVDADLATRNIDLDKLEAAITPRTKAIIPVDLAGLAVDRDRLYDIANRHKLRVVEDAAQSIGTRWKGRMLGSFGDLVSFSFHANKNITSAEGGCLVMNTPEEARLFEKMRLQGITRFPDGTMDMDVMGGKFNLTDIAAVIGLNQLKRLEEFNARRAELAKLYFRHFDRSLGCMLPLEDFENTNWHMFQPLLPIERLRGGRPAFIEGMAARGISVGVHYPAMHLFTFYRARGYKEGDYPVSEQIGNSTVTLPLFPAMRDEDVLRVCDAVRDVIHSLV